MLKLFKNRFENYKVSKKVKKLIKILEGDDDTVSGSGDSSDGSRPHAARMLGILGSIEAIEPLIHVLTSDNSKYVREEAALALMELNSKQAIKPLITALGDCSRLVRLRAIWTLSNLGDAQAIEPLIRNLQDEDDEHVKDNIAIALGNLRDPRAVAPIIKTYKNFGFSRYAFRHFEALGKIGTVEAKKFLIEILKDSTTKKEDRIYALEALIKTNHPNIKESLLEIIQLEDVDQELRLQFAQKLVELGDTRWIDYVIEYIFNNIEENNDSTSSYYIRWLGSVENERADDTIIRILEEESISYYKKWAAAEGIKKTYNEKIVKLLIKHLSSNLMGYSYGLERESLLALGRIGNLMAVEPAIKFLSDDSYIAESIRGGDPLTLASLNNDLSNLFGDYTSYFVNILLGGISQQLSEGGWHWSVYSYDLTNANQELNQFCKIKTIISDNFLHLISKRKDYEVEIEHGDGYTKTGKLSFNYQRESKKRVKKKEMAYLRSINFP